jgi:RimJ/RimL family protein N-acetyltransferase
MHLATERLILRPWADQDRAALAAIQSDPHVRRFFPRTMTPVEVEADIDLAIASAAANGFHFQAAELKENGRLAGLTGLGVVPEATRAAIPSRPAVEIGWVLDKEFWGQGLAVEGASAWLEYAWSIGLPEVAAFTSKINLPSQRVMQKLGMTYISSDDFGHPKIPADHPLSAHVVYRIAKPRA